MAGRAPEQKPGVEGAQLVKLFGIDPRTLTDLATRGVVVRIGRNRYDFVASIQGYVTHLREMAAARQGRDGMDAITESALLNRERRRKIVQDAEREAGNLIPVEMVERVIDDHIKGVKGMILGFCNEAQSEMPHLNAMDIDTLRKISERVLRDNVTRVMELTSMHPEVQEYIDKKRGVRPI